MHLLRRNLLVGIVVVAALGLFSLSAYAQTFSFAVFGDSHGNYAVYNKLIEKMNADQDIDFGIHTGDFCNLGTMSEYKSYLEANKKARFPIYTAMGNHDAFRGGWKNYVMLIAPLYYSFDYENSHFVIVNNAMPNFFDDTQFEWLKKDLETNRNKNLFVFFHKPVFDPTEMNNNHVMDSRHFSEELQLLFHQNKVKYVFSGHIHGYGRQERDGVVYVVNGGAGGRLYLPPLLGGFYHYVKVTVDGDRVGDEVIMLGDEGK